MRKGIAVICAAVALTVSLTGCDTVMSILPGGNGENPDTPTPVESDTTGQHIQVGVPEDDLDFGLEPVQNPEFSDVPDASAEPVQEQEALYIEQDGYAYRLDPATLEVIDEPLDPVTYEPITVDEEPTPEPTEESVVEEVQDDTPTRTEPTEENRYPNTGMFLEDDVWEP